MRMSSPARSTPSRLLALLIAGACALTSCGGDDDAPPDPPSSSPTTTSPEAEVESAYLAYWDMVAEVTSAPDPESPAIAEHSVDPARSELLTSVREFQAAGEAVHIGEDYGHAVSEVAIDGETATLRDCAVDDAAVVDVESGEVARQSTTTSLLDVTLVRQQGEWRVSTVSSTQNWDGATTCSG